MSKLYNHPIWPSPLPKVIALYLRLSSHKRLRHESALALLAQRLSCSVEEFLKLSRRHVADRLFPGHFERNRGRGFSIFTILKLLERYY